VRRWVLPCAVLGLALGLAHPARAQFGVADQAIGQGVRYLKSSSENQQIGEAALGALALHKAGVPANDPALQGLLAKVLERFGPEGYYPARRGGTDIYEAGVVAMVLSNVDPAGYKPQVQAIVNYLVTRQKANGSWDYDHRTAGDTSISQYALLGLWEADGIGVPVPPRVWDAAALWYMSSQMPDGGWVYHRDEPGHPETVSMTAAGVGSLLLCNRQLAPYRKGLDSVHPLLTPLVVEGGPQNTFKPVSSSNAINQAVRRGLDWLTRGYVPANSGMMGKSTSYGLYGLERVLALGEAELGSTKDAGSTASQWFGRGLEHLLAKQSPDGSWGFGDYGVYCNTAWSLLFCVRSTAQSVRKIEIRRLGAGTLVGGQGLPSDLENMVVAGGRVMVRPMNGAVEGMIAVLEDPRATNADSALAGLIDQVSKRGPDVLRPYKDRFRKFLTDRDPGLRRVACWALGRLGDLDNAPHLIRRLLDPDEAVVAEARVALEMLSRKLVGFGPPRNATPEQKRAAARRWRDWYESVRPPELEPLDDPELVAEPAEVAGS
jgi:hypothetical protein